MPTVAIIGGGISGLACAQNLVDLRPDLEVQVFEASERLGGAIHSKRNGEWICEAGPGAYIDRHPSTRRLIERLDLRDEVVAAGNAVRRRYIRRNGVLHAYPDSERALLTTALLSDQGRNRMMLEPIHPLSEDEDWTVSQFARAHLGEEAATMLLDPIVGGIYAGDPDQLSAASVLPRLVSIARAGGRVSDALLGPGQGRVGKGSMVSLESGLSRLIEALTDSLGQRIHRRCPVQAITEVSDGWRLSIGGRSASEVHVDAVVFTVHGQAACVCLGPLHADLEALLSNTPSPPVVVVNLGFAPRAIRHPMDGFGYLVPSSEGGSVLGVKWTTSIFPTGRAPANHSLLQVFMGGTRDPTIAAADPETWIARARAEISQTLGAHDHPAHVDVSLHRSGIPQYTVGHAQRVRRIEAIVDTLPGLFLGGTSLHGVGINACTTGAETLAKRVAAYIEPARPSTAAIPSRLHAR